MQLELFATERHEHVYVEMTGPHVQNPAITTSQSRWCWSCDSWVNRVGVSQWEAWGSTTEELAMRYARMVKSGELGRHDAYKFMHTPQYDFWKAVKAIDIAIGELSAGKEL
jgi:hypothetical protein